MDEQSQSSYESVDKSTHNESDVIEIKEECVVHEQEKLKTMNDTTAVKLDKPESVHVENANFDTSKCKDEDELQMDSATRKSTRKTLVPKRNIETEPRYFYTIFLAS
jgi:hypothetical protein